jgi:starch synthase
LPCRLLAALQALRLCCVPRLRAHHIMQPLKILFAASECASFVKTGGLADVVAALPRALRKLGHDVRIVIPRYMQIPLENARRHLAPMAVPLGGGEVWCAVWETRLPGSDVPVYMLDHQGLFARNYVYDPPGGKAPDNLARFSFLSRGSLMLCRHLSWAPDVIHCHDWQTALIPVLLNTIERQGALGSTATVLTIHNLAYQGWFPPAELPVTQLPWSVLRNDGLESGGVLNLLQGGLYHASKITAVSPHYAWEIRTPEGGYGLHRVLDFRGGDLIGVLNGIDDDIWNPATDPRIAARYQAGDLSGKSICKAYLQREMYLAERPDLPLIGVVSRLDWIKGTDLIMEGLERILAMGAQVVMLGSGSPAYERALRWRSDRGGDRFRAWIGFDEGLAHRIEAGADFFLMPSRAEPCGLNQLYSQRYGTLPIVRGVGGLEDTVDQYDPIRSAGTGFKFYGLSAEALVQAVAWAIDVWHSHPDQIHYMRERGMKKDMGWTRSARKYENVYRWAIDARNG